MIIKHAQIQNLGVRAENDFIEKTIAFLRENVPDWATSNEDDEMRSHIKDMIEMGEEFEIKKEINIQKLLYHWIKYDRILPFDAKIKELLNERGTGEDQRMKNVIKEVLSYGR